MAEDGKLTEEQVAEFNEGFRLFSTDGSGKIGAKQVGHVMRSLGLNPSNAEIAEYVGENTADKMVDFSEFLTHVTRQREREKNIEEDMKLAFKSLDKAGSGEISVNDLKMLMTSSGEPITAEEFGNMVAEYDIRGPTIKQDDFLKMMLTR